MSSQENASLLPEGEGGHEHDHDSDHELLEHERIPDFAANPTHRITTSGRWSEIVALQGVDENSVVVIDANATVIYDRLDIRVKAIGVYGTLQFAMDKSTSLTVQELLVYGSGQLEIGTRNNPVPSNISVSINIGDRPLDIANDPTTAGNGIIVLGKISVFGEQLQSTFVSLSQSPRAGDRLLHLVQIPSGWTVGDTISLPQTMADANHPLSEEFQITAIGLGTLQLDRPVGFDRPAAVDGDLATVSKGFDGGELRGHVANLTRNVRFRSENPNGNRGHVMLIGNADVDIRYAAFENLGRTRIGGDDSTTFDSDGKVVHLGTNQIGRYPIHIHHLIGPENGVAADPSVDPVGLDRRQFRIIGNSITDGKKWGIALHGSSYGLVSGNVLNQVDGAGIVGEDGSDAFNYITNNFVFALKGDGSQGRFDPQGTRGGAFWMRGGHNYWVGNVVAAAQEGFGFYIGNDFTLSQIPVVRIPKFPGADPSVIGEYVEDVLANFELLKFTDNQAYAVGQISVGSWNFKGSGDAPPLFANTTVWNSTGMVIYADYNDAIVDGLIVRGNSNRPTEVVFRGHNGGFDARNFDIQQASKGYFGDDRPPSILSFENGYARNYDGFTFTNDSQGIVSRRTLFRNVRFEAVKGSPLAVINTVLNPEWIRGGGYVDSINHTMQILVYAFQGDPTNNFRVYFNEQAADYVIPARAEGAMRGDFLTRSPVAFNVGGKSVSVQMPEFYVMGETLGQTGAQSWETHRAAILRELAPVTAIRIAGIGGLVSAIPGGEVQAIPEPLPIPAFWFKKNTQSGHGSVVDIVYKDFKAAGADAVLFSVDGGAWIREVANDGEFQLTGLTPGVHRIVAALAGPTFAPWGTRVAFDINVIANDELVSFDELQGQSVFSDSGEKSIAISNVIAGRLENGVRFNVVSTNPSVSGQAFVNWNVGSSTADLKYTPSDSGQADLQVTLTNAGQDKVFGTFDDIVATQNVTVNVSYPPFDPSAKVFFNALPTAITLPSTLGEQSITVTGIESGPGVRSFINIIVVGNLLAHSVDYQHGSPTATIKFTPPPGVTSNLLLDIQLINAGADRAYFSPDDLVHRQVVSLSLSPESSLQKVKFDPLPEKVTAFSNVGQQTISITGIEPGLGSKAIFEVKPTGVGLQTTAVDYVFGARSGSLQFTPIPGVTSSVQLEVTLRNAGVDGTYFTQDDATHQQIVTLDLVSPVSFDALPATISASSSLGERTISVTGIQSGPGILSKLELNTTGVGLQRSSVDYNHGEKTATVRFTPVSGVTASIDLTLTLRNAGPDGVFMSADDLVFQQAVKLALSPSSPAPTVFFDALPSTINASSSLGEQRIGITGVRSGPGTSSGFSLITAGTLQSTAIDFIPGSANATLRFTPVPDSSTSILLDLILRNAGPDNAYFTADDLTHRQVVTLEVRPDAVGSSRSGNALGSPSAANISKVFSPLGGVPASSNRALRTDINGDQIVSPLDALIVINALRSFGSGATGIENRPASADVNGDGRLSPIDALLIINTINSQRTAEGELSADYSDSAMSNKAVDLAITDQEVITSMKRKRFA